MDDGIIQIRIAEGDTMPKAGNTFTTTTGIYGEPRTWLIEEIISIEKSKGTKVELLEGKHVLVGADWIEVNCRVKMSDHTESAQGTK